MKIKLHLDASMKYASAFVTFLCFAILFPSVGNAEPFRISNNRANLVSGSKILLRTEECQNSDRRVVRISIQRGSEPAQALRRLTQRYSESALGGARFIDLENDGVPEIELTGSCGAGPSCERGIFKLSEDEKSMYHCYKGGYAGVQRTDNYFVTYSRGSCCSWEYLAYDPSSQAYPLKNFRYSVYIESVDDAKELVCKIQELAPNGHLKLVGVPPHELLRFCKHYGEDISVKIVNFEKIKKSIHGKKPAS